MQGKRRMNFGAILRVSKAYDIGVVRRETITQESATKVRADASTQRDEVKWMRRMNFSARYTSDSVASGALDTAVGKHNRRVGWSVSIQ